MEWYLTPRYYNTYYNCTNINIDDVPLAMRTRYTPHAYILFVLTTIYYILYIPCTISLWKHRDNSCYKMLLYKAGTDLGMIAILGYEHAYLTIVGAVYCSYPNLIYLSGVFVAFFWISESNAEAIVSLNRCISILSPHWTSTLFDGYKTLIWLMFPTAHALYWVWRGLPGIFTSIYWTWLFNPYVGYKTYGDGKFYESILHSVNDAFMSTVIPGIYLTFGVALLMKTRGFTTGSAVSVNKKQLMTFLQIFLISMMNLIGCSGYVYMEYFGVNETLMIVVQFLWFHIHGFPPVIYLTMNRTIQIDCKEMLMKLLQIVGMKKIVTRVTATVSVLPSQMVSNTGVTR